MLGDLILRWKKNTGLRTSSSLCLPILGSGEKLEFSLQLRPKVAEILLVKPMSQAQVEGKEKSQEEAISAQGGNHPQHCQQLHTHWVSKMGKES